MIKNLKNHELHLETKHFAKAEKANTIELLKRIEEVHRRKIFIEYGYSTLMKYMVGELGYSEAESWTRISAMKLITKCAEAEEQMIQGDLTLSNAATINDVISRDITQDPRKLIAIAKDKPNRQVKRELQPEKKDKRVLLSERLLKKMEKLIGSMSEVELIESLIDEKLKALEVSKSIGASKKPCVDKHSRYIPVEIKRELFKRSGHQCEHINKDGLRCSEKRNLQYDHIMPFSLGGPRTSDNLRLLCSGHNQYRAYQTYVSKT